MWKALIKLVEKWTCSHDWQQWEQIYVEGNNGYNYHVFHFVCKKCGKFKKAKSH